MAADTLPRYYRGNDGSLRRDRALTAVAEFAEEAREPLLALSRLTSGTRGPDADLATGPLLKGGVFASLCRRPNMAVEIRECAGEVPYAARKAHLGIRGLPSRWAFGAASRTLAEAMGDAMRGEAPAVLEALDELVYLSGGPETSEDRMLAVDTTYVDAWAVPRPKGEQSSDPEATGRILSGSFGAPDARHYGYAMVSGVRPGDRDEITRFLRVLTAAGDDVMTSQAVLLDYRAQHPLFDWLLVDRGFSQRGERFLTALRNAGLWINFDLKSHDAEGDREANLYGYPVLDGWVFSPAVPDHLRRLTRPAVNATPEEKAEMRALFNLRARYALKPLADLTPTGVRLQSPAYRTGGAGCEDLPLLRTHEAPDLRRCPGGHAPKEACLRQTLTWKAEHNPRFWQWPLYGTSDWETLHSKRSAVERSYAYLKGRDGMGLQRGSVRAHGLGPITRALHFDTIGCNLAKRFDIITGDHELFDTLANVI